MTPAYILAGGRSRRFGTDKARALLDGRPLLVRLQDALQTLGHDVTAVARETDAYADLHVRTIADAHPGRGPLAGVERALLDTLDRGDGWALVLSCDMVSLDPAWLRALESGRQPGAHAVCIRDDRWQPMPGLYHTRAMPHVTAALDRRELAMTSLLDRIGTPIPPPPGWHQGVCVNTPAQLARHLR